jgi:hypothetical protein
MGLTLHLLARATPRTRAQLKAESETEHKCSGLPLPRQCAAGEQVARTQQRRRPFASAGHAPLHDHAGSGSGGHGDPTHLLTATE